MAKQNLGKVACVPKGEYDNSVTYNKLDIVTYNGSSYIAIQETTTGNVPTNTYYWNLLAEKGDTGEKGDKGDKGDQGVQGIQGVQGPQGEAFNIYKTYSTIAEMNADKANVEEGKFVMIVSNVEDPDNAKLYVKGSTDFVFLTDMSGATGIQGPKGEQGIQGIQGIQGDKGEKGDKGDTGEVSLVNAENMLNMGAKTISSTGNSYQYTTTGKNLFDKSTIKSIISGSILDDVITSNTISIDYGSVSGNINELTLQPGIYYITAKIKLDSGTSGGVNRILIEGVSASVMEMTIKPELSANYQIYCNKITISEAVTITRIGVQLKTSNVNAVISFTDIMVSTSSDTTYEPYTGEIPSPSPDYPQEIETITDIKIVGKNLYGGTDPLTERYTYIMPSKIGETYTLSFEGSTTAPTSGGARAFLNNHIDIERSTIATDNKVATLSSTSQSYHLTLTSTINGYLFLSLASPVSSFSIQNIMLEKGSTATEYEEYKGVTIPMSTNELTKIGNISDKLNIDLDTGAISKVSNIGKTVLDGSESWQYWEGGLMFYIAPTTLNYLQRQNEVLSSSNYYICLRQTTSGNDFRSLTSQYDYAMSFANETNGLRLKNINFTTANDFKDWLSTNNVIVYYVLATPTTSQISTLSQSDIDIIKSIPANELDIIANLDTTLSSTTYLDTLIEYLRTQFEPIS